MSPTGRRARERAIEIGLAACAGLSLLVTAGIVAVLAAETVAFFRDVSPVAFLTGTTWTPLFFNQQFGVLPLVVGTVLVAAIALATAVPAGIVSALYLSEYAPPRVRRVAKPALEVLAGIPTVVYGYFALLFVTPWLQQWIPGLTGYNALGPGLVLGLMIVPLVSSLCEDALSAVPSGLREASFALGATRLQTAVGVVLPAAWSGVSAAVVLAMSRAIGLEEYGGRGRWARLAEINIANLAGVPSIVYGLLGLGVFVQTLRWDRSLLAGAGTLALLVLPIVIITAREALRAVPVSVREASLALGATKWQTVWHQVLPMSLPGLLTGLILAISRAVGETAPLLVIGALTYVPFVPDGPRSPFTALPIQIYTWVSRPREGFRANAAAAILVLLATLLLVNGVAILARDRATRRRSA